jgi:hypothetical protein
MSNKTRTQSSKARRDNRDNGKSFQIARGQQSFEALLAEFGQEAEQDA